MNELIESYERKLKNIAPMIESAKFDEDTNREIRLRTKASCYRTFLSELKQQCNIDIVVGQSEQLCDYCKKPLENTCCNDCLEEMDNYNH